MKGEEELAAMREFAREIAHRQRREVLGLPLMATDAECEEAEAAQQDYYCTRNYAKSHFG